MASDTIEQMAEKIRTFAEDLIRDNFAPREDAPAPFHAGQTVDAATAWEAMEQGWEVKPDHGRAWSGYFMNGSGHIASRSQPTMGCYPDRARFAAAFLNYTFTLIRIHPDAHQHALQRLLAAGLKVGDRVEVVHTETSDTSFFHKWKWVEDFPPGSTFEVQEINNDDHLVTADDSVGSFIPAHVLRLLPAEQDTYTPPCDAPEGFEWAGEYRVPRKGEYFSHIDGFHAYCCVSTVSHGCWAPPRHILRKLPASHPEDQVPPATTTGEGEGAVDFEGDPSAETLPADSPTRWVPEPDKWYVWSREAGPPNVKHTTHAEARAEAERLAAKHPGREFKVLGQVGENIVVQQQPARFEEGDRVWVEGHVCEVIGETATVDFGNGAHAQRHMLAALRPAKGVGE